LFYDDIVRELGDIMEIRAITKFGKTPCVKVVDKAITMDNLPVLCLVVNVCRGTARRPRYRFLTD